MANENKPIRVQFAIGQTSSLDLQEWANNQSLPISKAIKEALEHFVRVYGTQDISSHEVRSKLAAQINVTPLAMDKTNDNFIQKSPVKDIDKPDIVEPKKNKSKKIIDRGDINI